MAKKVEKVEKEEKKVKSKSQSKSLKDESNEKDFNEKSLSAESQSDEDLLLLDNDDDEYSPASTEDIDEDVEFLMSNVVEGKGSSKSSSESAELAAQEDNSKSAFEGITASSLKNFRHHPDIENFYRFVFDNDLRIEALSILDENIAAKKIRKALKDKKEKVH
jgi:hypothetical protein